MAFGPNSLDLLESQQVWDIEDINQYTKQDYYLVKNQYERLSRLQPHQKLCKTWPWQANAGTTAKFVRKELSPQARSMFFPAQLNVASRVDKINQTEVITYANVYRHKVESRLLNFRPAFVDFLPSMKPAHEDITEKIGQLPELFYRSGIFHGAPYVYVCGYGLVGMPVWTGGNISAMKTAADLIAACVTDGTSVQPLTYTELDRARQVLKSDLGGRPRSGSIATSGKNEASMRDKWILVGGTELYDNMDYDEYRNTNRALDNDVVAKGITGPISKSIDFMAEDFELRLDSTTGLFPEPQTLELNPNAYNYGQVVPSPDYTSANCTVSFLYGNEPYDAIKVGPPPSEFASNKMDSGKFAGLDWNGKVKLTGDVLIEVAAGQYDSNKHGEFVQYIASIAMGLKENDRRNVLPIISLRTRAGSSL